MAIQAKPLTNTEVKAAKTIGKDLSLHDGGGLLLFVKTSGVKTWRFRYYHPLSKKRTTVTFGHYPALSLAEARQKREAAKALLAKKMDPQEYQRTILASEQEARINTLEKVATEWFKIKQSSITANHARDVWRSLERDIFPVVGQVGIQEIKARTLITALEPVKAKGALETVKRLTQRLNEIMIFAVNCGLIDANPAGGIGKAFEKPKKKNRPALTPRELPELMQALSVALLIVSTISLLWNSLTFLIENPILYSYLELFSLRGKFIKLIIYWMKFRLFYR